MLDQGQLKPRRGLLLGVEKQREVKRNGVSYKVMLGQHGNVRSLFVQERNDCVLAFVSVHMGMQSFRFAVVVSVLSIHSSNNNTPPVLRVKSLIIPVLDQFCNSLPVHTATEQNDCMSLHFLYQFLSFHFLVRQDLI